MPDQDRQTFYVPDAQFDAVMAVYEHAPRGWEVTGTDNGQDWLLVVDDSEPELAAQLPPLQLWDPDRHPHPRADQDYDIDLPVASPAALAAQAAPDAAPSTSPPAAVPDRAAAHHPQRSRDDFSR